MEDLRPWRVRVWARVEPKLVALMLFGMAALLFAAIVVLLAIASAPVGLVVHFVAPDYAMAAWGVSTLLLGVMYVLVAAAS